MKKTAILYSFNTKKTAQAAKEIKAAFKPFEVDEVNAEDINGEKFLQYDLLVLGVPTWFDGELPNYWDEFVPELETLDLKGKTVALFGNGDQVGYPENFVDGIGLLAEILETRGAKLVGETSAEGYNFESSRAFSNGKFKGLALDFENQSNLNAKRIKDWVEGLKKII